jgi:hypothetical protein
MPTSSTRTFRDLVIAALVGLGAEVALFLLNFEAAGDLNGDHPWLQILQKPGGEIALRLLRHCGEVPAIVCAVLIQTAIFAALALSIIYVYRLLTVDRHAQ